MGPPGPRRAGPGSAGGRAGGPLVAALLALVLLSPPIPPTDALPIVDPGLFVILGVRTCGGGGGYCLLGSDCTLDRDFAADDAGGHCEGLRAAFTPAAHFSCCKYVERSNATLPGEPADTTATEDPAAAGAATTVADDAENVIETEVLVKPAGSAPPALAPPASAPPASAPPAAPAGPASGQTVVAVSEVYKVKGAAEEAEVAEVVAAPAPTKEAVLETPACLTPGGDVNPCWRSSFQDATGATLCSGTLLGVDAAVTTAVCAARIMEAGPAVVLRVDGLSLPVRDIVVHAEYRAAPADPNDIAMVRLLLAGGPGLGGGPVGAPSPSCIACLPPPVPPPGAAAPGLDGRTCFALAARLNGLGVETSAVCSGRVAAADTTRGGQGLGLGLNVKLHGCEVATVKATQEEAEGVQAQAVRAREGAAMLCDGALAGLASTTVGAYSDLRRHTAWITRTLASTRGSAFLV